jgi:uncharacterized protein YybS (DUF2232 family)
MRDIVSGVVISILLFTISIYLPIVGFFFALFIPLPILFYRVKLGRQGGLKLAGLTAVIMVLILGHLVFDILFFLTLVVMGFYLGELYEQNLSVEKTVGLVCGAVMLATLAGLIFFSVVAHKGIGEFVTAYVAKNLELTMLLYENMGVSEENIGMLQETLEQIQYVLVRLLPSLSIMSTLMVIWINIMASKPLFILRNLRYPRFGSLKLWRAPDVLIWGVIVCGAALMIPEKGIKLTALNGLIVLLTIFFFQGIAITAYFFEKKKFPRGIRFFLYSLIAIQQLVLLVVVGIGVFDVWFNFRKLGAPDTT